MYSSHSPFYAVSHRASLLACVSFYGFDSLFIIINQPYPGLYSGEVLKALIRKVLIQIGGELHTLIWEIKPQNQTTMPPFLIAYARAWLEEGGMNKISLCASDPQILLKSKV